MKTDLQRPSKSVSIEDMNSKDLAIASNFKRLVEQRLTPLEVRVFGSQARGDAADDSDLDVFVLVEHATREIHRYISDCAWDAGFEQDVVVVPVIVDRERLKGPIGDSAFMRHVYREGIPL